VVLTQASKSFQSYTMLVSRPMKLRALVLILAPSIFALAQHSTNSGKHFVLEKNAPVPMRNGVVLRADVMRPAEDGTSSGREPNCRGLG
jgi:predicted acyl esterase